MDQIVLQLGARSPGINGRLRVVILSVLCAVLWLAPNAFAQQQVFSIPQLYTVAPTVSITSLPGQSRIDTFVLRNLLDVRLTYQAEVIQGGEFLSIVSYSGFIDIEGVDDRDLIEFETTCQEDTISATQVGIIRVTISDPAGTDPAVQDILVNLFCGRGATFELWNWLG